MTETKRNRGFTLIELLVVLAILAMLAGLVGPKVMDALGSSKSKAAKVQIEDLSAALDMYRLDVGNYPKELNALVEGNGSNWNGPYLKKKKLPKDPWGNDYVYRFPGEHGDFDIVSYGADGQPGGDGDNRDITSWD